ncbi:cell division protein FtsK [Mycobacterium avium]|uniref:cell division protein FtsK n=1 Tax=Mycobacterium avium TaxID=1764 RepID=UPI002155B7DF|nr:cell division protein FtsK [Mycobacterium avium]
MNPFAPYPGVPADPYSGRGIDLIDLINRLTHLLIAGVVWSIVIACLAVLAAVAWRLSSPDTYEQHVTAPARRMRWRLWALFGWSRVAKACGLSASEQVTRNTADGKTTTTTKWTHPRVLSVDTSDHCLRITVRTRTGQMVDDLERAIPAIRDALRAHSARTTVVSPATVRMEFVMRPHLSTAETAIPTSRIATTGVELGRRENGSPWTLRIAERQTLTVGCSGSGKGSIFWGIAGGFGPAVKAGVVRLLAIDLKYGIEVAIGSPLFTTVATTETAAAQLLQKLEEVMDRRGKQMAGTARAHRPAADNPLLVLLIDELAGLTAYMTDANLKKQVAGSLSRILTKGRGLGIVVVAFMQDPRKEILPMRGLFTQTIALRLRSRDEVAMVLGDGLADVAPAHRISPNDPGTGYVIDEDGQVTKVRSDFWSDDQISTTAKKYGRTRTTEEGQRHE